MTDETTPRQSAKILPFRRPVVVPRMHDTSDRIRDLEAARDRNVYARDKLKREYDRATPENRAKLSSAIDDLDLTIDLINKRITEERTK